MVNMFEAQGPIILLGLISLAGHWFYMHLDWYMVLKDIEGIRVLSFLANLALWITYMVCAIYVPAVSLLDFALRSLAIFNVCFIVLIFIGELNSEPYLPEDAEQLKRFNFSFGLGGLIIAVVLDVAGVLN